MITRTARILFLAISIAILSQSAFAYRLWEPEDGVPIRQGDEMATNGRTSSCSAVNGDFILYAWSDCRTGDNDIYAQLYNEEGQPQWAENGLLIARGAGSRQESPYVMAASDGTWIITWVDFRNDSQILERSDIFAQKVTSAGDIQWPENSPDYGGVAVTVTENATEMYPCAFDDGDGGAMVIWVTDRNLDSDLYAMHILADGTPDGNWTLNGNPFADGDQDQGEIWTQSYSAVPDGNGGIIAGWVDTRDINEYDIYMNRISTEGELAWGASSGVALDTDVDYARWIRAVPDGAGGAYFSWNGEVAIDDEQLSVAAVLRIAHVTADGNSDWDDNGLQLFPHEPGFEYYSVARQAMVQAGEGELILAWEHCHTYEWPSGTDLYMQRITMDEENQPVLEWGEEGEEQYGIAICDEIGSQNNIKGIADGNGGAIFTWLDGREGRSHEYNVYTQRINEDGTSDWGAEGGIETSAYTAYNYYEMNRVHQVGEDVIVLWQEWRQGSMGAFLQRHDLETGAIQMEDEGVVVYSGLSGNATSSAIAVNHSNPEEVWFAWIDNRYRHYGRLPFVQKLDISTGQPAFEANGISALPHFPLPEGPPEESVLTDSLTMIPDGEGGIYLGWKDSRPLYSQTTGFQHILSDGTLDWGDEGLVIPTVDFFGTYTPTMLLAPDGGIFVAFTGEYEANYYQHVFLQKIDTDGSMQFEGEDGRGIILNEGIEEDETLDDIVFFEDGDQEPTDATIGILYSRDSGPGTSDIYMSGVSQDGTIRWQTPICSGEQGRRYPFMVKVENGIVIAWLDNRNGNSNSDIYGQLIHSDGTIAWEENGIPLVDVEDRQRINSITTNDGSSFWVSWLHENRDNSADIYIQKYDLDGTPVLVPETGIQITRDLSDSRKSRLSADCNGGVYLVWESVFGSNFIDLYCTELDAEGVPVEGIPEYDGVPLTQAYQMQVNAMITPTTANGAICVWEDYRSTDTEFLRNIYAQHIEITGIGVNDLRQLHPTEWSLSPAYPNPFNPSTQIGFSLDQRMPVTLTVYDVLGRQVVKLVDGVKDAGRHVVTWNGMDTHGRAVASGTYFYRLEGDGKQLVQKMILVK